MSGASRLRQGAAGKAARCGVTAAARPVKQRLLPSPASATHVAKTNLTSAVLWMGGALLSFSLMAVSVRGMAAQGFSIFEILGTRSAAALFILGSATLLWPELRAETRARNMKLHLRPQRHPLRLAICVGAEPHSAAARHGVLARIHHAGVDGAARDLAPQREDDAKPDRRRPARHRRRPGDPAARHRRHKSGGLSGARGGVRFRHRDDRDQAAHGDREHVRDHLLDVGDPVADLADRLGTGRQSGRIPHISRPRRSCRCSASALPAPARITASPMHFAPATPPSLFHSTSCAFR